MLWKLYSLFFSITFQTFLFLKKGGIFISLLFSKHILRKEGISDKANNHLLSCSWLPTRQENDLYIFCTEFMSFLFFETWRGIRTTTRFFTVTIQEKMGFVLIYCCLKISYLRNRLGKVLFCWTNTEKSYNLN